MRPRYNIAKLRTIYGRTSPPDTEALCELRVWRRRADGLIQLGRVADGLLLIEACSDLTLAYRKSRALVLPSLFHI